MRRRHHSKHRPLLGRFRVQFCLLAGVSVFLFASLVVEEGYWRDNALEGDGDLAAEGDGPEAQLAATTQAEQAHNLSTPHTKRKGSQKGRKGAPPKLTLWEKMDDLMKAQIKNPTPATPEPPPVSATICQCSTGSGRKRWQCSPKNSKKRPPRQGKNPAGILHEWVLKNSSMGLAYSHMPMVARLPNQSIAVAFQAGGNVEGGEDQHMRVAVSQDKQGLKWGRVIEVPTFREGAQWGPVLHYDAPTGWLWLFYSESKTCLRPATRHTPARWYPGGDIWATILPSVNGNWEKDWTTPRLLYSEAGDGGIPKVLANTLTVLRTGEWVLPFWRERHDLPGVCEFNQNSSAGVLISEDGGSSWQSFGRLTSPGTWLIEGSVVQLKDESLLMLFRTTKGTLYQTKSTDRGRTWSMVQPTWLPNPGSKVHVTVLPEGQLMMAYNAHRRIKGPYLRSRTMLDLALSTNGGDTWGMVARLETAWERGLMFHYPTVLPLSPCRVLVVYTISYDFNEHLLPEKQTVAGGIRAAVVDLEVIGKVGQNLPPAPIMPS